ncbi:MAG TPA: alpha/beta hydrolase [Propionibacteriaceae bacterium]|nr:alpha/beta hydrolase [Propionibacteriaceae bacterium]
MTIPALHVPARTIPVPATISPEAQRVLGFPPAGVIDWPDTVEAQVAIIDQMTSWSTPGDQGAMVSGCYAAARTETPCDVERVTREGVEIAVATPEGVADEDRRAFLYFHGAFIFGGGHMAETGATMLAGNLGIRTWAVDYRMPPVHQYPAPLDDCVAAYRGLLADHRPEDIVLGGVSAGGNLLLATLHRIRAEGLPMPAAVVINTPLADLTASGDTVYTNNGIDASYAAGEGSATDGGLATVMQMYTGGVDVNDPFLSPVLGDYTGFPPALLTSGTRDFLLSDTVRVHRKLRAAGVEADLHVWEGAGHFLFLGMAPEDLERAAETRLFIDRHVTATAAQE